MLCDRHRVLVRSALREARVQIHTRERHWIFHRIEIAASATYTVHERHDHE